MQDGVATGMTCTLSANHHAAEGAPGAADGCVQAAYARPAGAYAVSASAGTDLDIIVIGGGPGG